MIRKFALSALAVLLGLGLAVGTARADSLSFTLSNPNQVVGPAGGTLSFTGTTTATPGNARDLYLNFYTYSVASPITLDATPFFNNFPFFLTASGPGSSATGVAFNLGIAPGTPFGIYAGAFDLYGGVDSQAGDLLGSVNYSVNVSPEPSSLMLLGTGVMGALGAVKRKRRMAV